jgi:hypothetical protein
MSSSTLQQTPNLSDRRVRLLEARLSGSGNGGGSSNASAESPSLNHTNSGNTVSFIKALDDCCHSCSLILACLDSSSIVELDISFFHWSLFYFILFKFLS